MNLPTSTSRTADPKRTASKTNAFDDLVRVGLFQIGEPAGDTPENPIPRLEDFQVTRLNPLLPPAADDAASLHAVLIIDHARDDHRPSAAILMNLSTWLRKHSLGCVAITRRPWAFDEALDSLMCLRPGANDDLVRGALAAMARLRPVWSRVEAERINMRQLGKRLQNHFDELDHDLRLASRLQNEMLPKAPPNLGPVRFATVFRPCRWVSGDIFDISRLDEDHVGLYLADAVGHGVAAGLLTMLIRNTIRPKQIRGQSYELLRPAEILRRLNENLVAQELPHSQFITAWYGALNLRTLELTYSVAGHPPPLLIDPAGICHPAGIQQSAAIPESARTPESAGIHELSGSGCLLGVFDEQVFTDQTIRLTPGQRVLLYSDGLENLLIAERNPPQPVRLQPGIDQLLRLPQDEFLGTLNGMLDREPGGLTAADDISAVVLDVMP